VNKQTPKQQIHRILLNKSRSNSSNSHSQPSSKAIRQNLIKTSREQTIESKASLRVKMIKIVKKFKKTIQRRNNNNLRKRISRNQKRKCE